MGITDALPVQEAFRTLRKAWFDTNLQPQLEKEAQQASGLRWRDSGYVAAAKSTYDRQTEEIIDGVDRNVAPESESDLYRII